MTDTFITLDANTLSNKEIHGYLVSAIAPRPIAFASTINQQGKVNLSPFSYFNVFSTNPPIVVFSPARSGRTNETKHTLDNVLEVPEVCIGIVNHPIVEKMSLASTAYPKGVNEFVKAGFTEQPSEVIKPPRIRECPISMECTVDEVIALGDQGGAGNLVVSRVQRIHINKEYLNEAGKLDSTKLDLVGRMGESWYCRADEDSMFEIPKPLRTTGMGVDQLPESIRNSPTLTANNVGRLGNLEELPSKKAVNTARGIEQVQLILENQNHSTQKQLTELQLLAKSYLEADDIDNAFSILMIADEL
ncbi:MAG: flavin reductase family protein [Balneolaceae bacterium]|nr:flavin reductase family protein [Balneolaceae bacterium]